MRITASGVVQRKPRPRPSPRQRWLFFVLGAFVGAALGYGYLTSAPGPSPRFFSMQTAPWILVPAIIVGILGAFFLDAIFGKPGGRYRFLHDDDDS